MLLLSVSFFFVVFLIQVKIFAFSSEKRIAELARWFVFFCYSVAEERQRKTFQNGEFNLIYICPKSSGVLILIFPVSFSGS